LHNADSKIFAKGASEQSDRGRVWQEAAAGEREVPTVRSSSAAAASLSASVSINVKPK